MGQTDQSHLLTLPPNIGRLIVETGAVFARPLLAANNFVSFCKDRNLNIDRERLFRFERLGIFAPVFRVRTPNDDIPPFFFPVRKENNWFDKGLAWDTTSLGAHEIPDESDQTQEAYYSIFQIDHLSSVIREMTLETHMDAYLESQDSETIDLPKNEWLELFRHHLDSLQMHEYRRSIPLLCQFISERFYPHARGDQRSIQVTHSSYSDHWINAYQKDFDWHKFARAWDSKPTETLFNLTQAKLSHAYKTLDFAQQHLDPLERWYQLVQFVSVNQRDRLKLDALCAETICEGAQMLRLLHKSLYKEELPQPNETTGTIITHFPELAIRRDVRRHLEFVTNRFGVNPQPRLTILVEGPSEERAITKIFEEYLGLHPGKLGVEIIVLWGVDAATGSKEDNFRAIIRLIDYLHHHQTIAFLVLDNENYAKKLQAAARKAKSIHHKRRFVTRPEYIRIWKNSFEFDNFSCSEIASAMNDLANGNAKFSRQEVVICKNASVPGACLSKLYEQKSGYGIKKIKLAEILIDKMLSTKARKIETRPIVVTLERIERLAALNHLPTRNEIWERNQASKYLGKKRP